VTLHLYIPTDSVGAVIGKKGATIARLQQQAVRAGAKEAIDGLREKRGLKIPASDMGIYEPAVRITVPPESKTVQTMQSLWSPVVIRGPPASCFSLLQSLPPISPEIDDVILELPLPRSRHATIIGAKGATIRQLSADSNVRIAVPARGEFLPPINEGLSRGGGDLASSGGKREVAAVTFEGAGEDVRSCMMALLTMIHEGQVKHEVS
jgi:hypothetical protein